MAIPGSETGGALRPRRGADGGDAVVVDEDHRDLQVLLYRRDQLLGHHQVRAVTDHDVDLTLGSGQLHAQAAGDLVAHRRVAVLDVVALGVSGAPELVEVAGHRSRRANDHVWGPGQLSDWADDLGLRRQGTVSEVI